MLKPFSGAAYVVALILVLSGAARVDAESPTIGPNAAGAAAARACLAPEAWVAAVRARSAGVSVLVLADLTGIEAKASLKTAAGAPVQPVVTADRVTVLGARSRDGRAAARFVLMAFFHDGCLVASGRADAAVAARIFRGTEI